MLDYSSTPLYHVSLRTAMPHPDGELHYARASVCAYGGVNAGVDDDTDTEDTDEERFETPPARSPADPDLFVDTH